MQPRNHILAEVMNKTHIDLVLNLGQPVVQSCIAQKQEHLKNVNTDFDLVSIDIILFSAWIFHSSDLMCDFNAPLIMYFFYLYLLFSFYYSHLGKSAV